MHIGSIGVRLRVQEARVQDDTQNHWPESRLRMNTVRLGNNLRDLDISRKAFAEWYLGRKKKGKKGNSSNHQPWH